MASLRGLDPRFLPYAQVLYSALQNFDARFIITSGVRTRSEQEELYSKYLRAQAEGLQTYTTLPPGRSQHERGLAIDVARTGTEPDRDQVLRLAGTIWREFGFTWGGQDDPVHFGAPRGW